MNVINQLFGVIFFENWVKLGLPSFEGMIVFEYIGMI